MIVFCPQDSHLYECPADTVRPKPVRPPPRPPVPPSVTSTKAAAGAEAAVCYLNSNTKTTVEVNDNLNEETDLLNTALNKLLSGGAI